MAPVARPVAVLKMTWSDAPWDDRGPVGLPYDDALVNRMYLPLRPEWGPSGFWRRSTFGLLDLEGSEVFPWRRLAGIPTPVPGMGPGRAQVIDQAIAQWRAEGAPLDRFPSVVVLVAPRSPSADAGGLAGRLVCLVQMGDDGYFCAHELGHALGFDHTLGPEAGTSPPRLGVYNDPYCVMGDGESVPPAPPADGPPAGDGYWTDWTTLPSAATLCVWLEGFTDDARHVRRAGPLTPAFRRSQRIRARDLPAGDGPVALRIDVPGDPPGKAVGDEPPPAPVAWIVELRRPESWDRGLGSGDAAPPGVVVHSLRPIDDYADGVDDFRPRAVYEGVVPLSVRAGEDGPPPGDADARFDAGAFTVRVDAAAADLAWADVTVGGALLGREGAVGGTFGVPEGAEDHGAETGRAEGVPVFVCGRGDYAWTLHRSAPRLRSTAWTVGYDRPELRWSVNGVPVAEDPTALRPVLRVPVTSRRPLPSGGVVEEPRTARVGWRLDGPSLLLTGDPDDGVYALDVRVEAREGDAARTDPSPPSAAGGPAEMRCLVLTYEPAYYEALERCVARVQDIDERFSRSRTWRRRFRRDDPPAVRIAVIESMRRGLAAEGSAALAEQLGAVAAALRGRGAGGP